MGVFKNLYLLHGPVPAVDFSVLKNELLSFVKVARERKIERDVAGNGFIGIDDVPLVGEKGVDSGHCLIDLYVAADSREGDALAQPSGIVKYKHTTAMIDQIDLVAVKNQLIHPDACDFPIEVAGFGEKFELCRVLLKFVLGLIVQPDVLTIRQDGMADQEIKIFIEGVLGYFVQVFVQDIEFLKIGIERVDPEIGR